MLGPCTSIKIKINAPLSNKELISYLFFYLAPEDNTFQIGSHGFYNILSLQHVIT